MIFTDAPNTTNTCGKFESKCVPSASMAQLFRFFLMIFNVCSLLKSLCDPLVADPLRLLWEPLFATAKTEKKNNLSQFVHNTCLSGAVIA
jgi:hypothetical protein